MKIAVSTDNGNVPAYICVTSIGPDMEAEVDPKFGRAHYFLIIDPKTSVVESMKNPYRDAAQGAGIQAAQLVSSKNVDMVFTGACGPKAEKVLQSAGIQIKIEVSGKVKDVLANFKSQAK